MHRFMVEPGLSVGDMARFDEREAQHAYRVLRLKPGARVQLSDSRRLFWGELDADGARVLSECEGAEPPILLTLYQGLPKFEKLELICQKATELGFGRIVPVKMARCVVRLDEKEGEKRRERLRRICQEATKQCGRAHVPEVLAPVSYRQALEMMRSESLLLLAWEEARGQTLSRLRERVPPGERIGLIIGPEGGISPEEAAQATDAGAEPVTLGPRILRTETAAIAAGAVIMNLWGDL